jgi:SMODS and SLOG-associating 2TM effector domain family 5
MDVDSRVKDLLYRMNVTKGSRFNASKRLEGRDRRMALLIALASAVVIALTFMSTAYRLPPAVVSDLNVVTMVASVLILAVSLIQYSNDDAVNAEQHHRCGLEVNELRGQLQAMQQSISEENLREFARRYSHILDKYSVNHDLVDYDRYRLDHPDVFKLSLIEKLFINLRSLTQTQWPNLLMAVIAVASIFLVFWYVIPARQTADGRSPPPVTSTQRTN